MENDLLSDSIAINCYSDMVYSRHTRIHPLEGKYEDIKTHQNASACVECGQYTTRNLLEYDPVVSAYRAFFSLFDWSLVEHWQEQTPARGRPGHPESAYLKALLVRI